MKKVILRTVKLNKVYKSAESEFHALHDVDLEIYEGDFTAIMGSSGSGKSTLLHLLTGLDGAASGEIYFEGARIDTFNEKKWSLFRRKNIGFVHQSMNLVPSLSIFDNVALPGYLANKNKRQAGIAAKELLNDMGILKTGARLPAEASGGEQQRAAVARALEETRRLRVLCFLSSSCFRPSVLQLRRGSWPVSTVPLRKPMKD